MLPIWPAGCLICWFALLSLLWGNGGLWEQWEDEEAVSGCLLMVRSVVSSTDSGLSPMTLSPLHITGHNSTHLAVWGLGGLGIKSVERPNGRRREQLRALLTRSRQENIFGADPGNYNDPLATEEEDERQPDKRQTCRLDKGDKTVIQRKSTKPCAYIKVKLSEQTYNCRMYLFFPPTLVSHVVPISKSVSFSS